MIVEKQISFRRLLQVIWKELICIFLVSSIPVVLLIYFDLGHYTINASIPLVIGTAIAIFLGFQTNSAYERWWEARKLWGGVITESRNLVRLSHSYLSSQSNAGQTNAGQTLVREICYRQIAWSRLLDRTLKNLSFESHLDTLIADSDQLAMLKAAHDPLIRMLSLQSQAIGTMLRQQMIDTRQAVAMEEVINRLTDYYGGCQRIKSTVFPAHYTFFTRVFIWVFLLLLAFSLPAHENANYALIPAIFLIGWVFFMVEGIGSYMQDPFVNNRNVIPMQALSRNIERDLRAMIGETDLPEPIQPVEGALY